jgi:hypothetical protein
MANLPGNQFKGYFTVDKQALALPEAFAGLHYK